MDTKVTIHIAKFNRTFQDQCELSGQNWIPIRQLTFQQAVAWTRYFDAMRSFRWKEPWEGPLVVAKVSTSWAEVILRVKWRIEIQKTVVMLGSVLWLVLGRVMWLVERMEWSAFWFSLWVKVTENCKLREKKWTNYYQCLTLESW